MQFPPTISLDPNHSSEIPHVIGGTRVYILDSGPPKNCVIEEIIPETNEHYSDKLTDTRNSFWVSFDSDEDEDIKRDDDTSSESYVSNSKVVSKPTLVPIMPHFDNLPCQHMTLGRSLG